MNRTPNNKIKALLKSVVKLIIWIVPMLVLSGWCMKGIFIFIDAATMVDLVKGAMISVLCAIGVIVYFFWVGEVFYG